VHFLRSLVHFQPLGSQPLGPGPPDSAAFCFVWLALRSVGSAFGPAVSRRLCKDCLCLALARTAVLPPAADARSWAPVGLWHACLCLRVTGAALRLCFAGAGEGLAVPFTAALLSLTFSKRQDSTAGLQVLAGWLRGAASAHDERQCAARSCQQQPCLSPA
jgi:hypothetical protein